MQNYELDIRLKNHARERNRIKKKAAVESTHTVCRQIIQKRMLIPQPKHLEFSAMILSTTHTSSPLRPIHYLEVKTPANIINEIKFNLTWKCKHKFFNRIILMDVNK